MRRKKIEVNECVRHGECWDCWYNGDSEEAKVYRRRIVHEAFVREIASKVKNY